MDESEEDRAEEEYLADLEDFVAKRMYIESEEVAQYLATMDEYIDNREQDRHNKRYGMKMNPRQDGLRPMRVKNVREKL